MSKIEMENMIRDIEYMLEKLDSKKLRTIHWFTRRILLNDK